MSKVLFVSVIGMLNVPAGYDSEYLMRRHSGIINIPASNPHTETK
jgi:hypothetical protein